MHSTSTVIKLKKNIIFSLVTPSLLILPIIFYFHFMLIKFCSGFGVHRGEFKVYTGADWLVCQERAGQGLCPGVAAACVCRGRMFNSHGELICSSGLWVLCVWHRGGCSWFHWLIFLFSYNSPLVLVVLFAGTHLQGAHKAWLSLEQHFSNVGQM